MRLMKLEEQNLNAISKNMKVSQLMMFSMNVILIQDVIELRLKQKFMNLLRSMLN